MNQYKDLMKEHDKIQKAYDNCKLFVDDEDGETDITYEDVRTVIDYVTDLEYNIAVMLEEVKDLKKSTEEKIEAFRTKVDSLEYEVKHTNDIDTGACPHGYEDWSDCPDCCH